MGQLWTKLFRQRDVRVLLLGLDGAGKTTILYRLKLGEVVTTTPTIGFNVEQLQYKNLNFTAWDIGARDKMRPLFRHYYKGTDAVVIVIDSSDAERLDELYCDVLKPAMTAEDLAGCVFLFIANKKDLPNTVCKNDIAARLNLKSMKHVWSVIETSAVTGEGLIESMDWLATNLGAGPMRRTSNPHVGMTTDKQPEVRDNKLQHRAYYSRAYNSFKCLFVHRPNSLDTHD